MTRQTPRRAVARLVPPDRPRLQPLVVFVAGAVRRVSFPFAGRLDPRPASPDAGAMRRRGIPLLAPLGLRRAAARLRVVRLAQLDIAARLRLPQLRGVFSGFATFAAAPCPRPGAGKVKKAGSPVRLSYNLRRVEEETEKESAWDMIPNFR